MTQSNEVEVIKSPQEYLPEDQAKAVSIDLAEAKEKAVSLRVVDDTGMDEANAVCGKIRARQKGIENFRLAIVKPFKDHISKIDKYFKDLGAQFDEPREALEEKVLKCRNKKIEAERKERERLAEEARKKEEEIKAKKRKEAEELAAKGREAEAEAKRAEADAVVVAPKEQKKEVPAKSSYQEGVGRTTFIKDAEHRIHDIALIPKEFWIVDEKKIGKRVREITAELEVGKVYTDKIPGVVITCTERPSYAGEK